MDGDCCLVQLKDRRRPTPGRALEKIHDSLWLAEGELVDFYSFPYPTRSVIARLENGDLWVWSPVKLTADLRLSLDCLGPVRHLVSPNKIHHLYLRDWKDAYPDADLWGPLSTIRKRRDLNFREALGDSAPIEWRDQIDQAWFRGSLAMDEIVFFHRPSQTLIVADLIEALDDQFLRRHWSWWGRILARIGGISAADPHAPLDWRLSFVNRTLARAARDKVLNWPTARVLMAHGEWRRAEGRAFLVRSLAWLGPS